MQTFSSQPGTPSPLGASPTKKGYNFAFFAPSAEKVTLGLFENGEKKVEIFFDHQTDGVWHTEIELNGKNLFYAYKVGDNWVVDPYAKELSAGKLWGKKEKLKLGKLERPKPFNWENDKLLQNPFENLSIYEMHVRGFTQDTSSKVKNPGTFLGLIEKIPYLKSLGINAVELLPVFEFEEMPNYWGYSSSHFFAPMSRYGTVDEFKQMVKALHTAGIEVILDVVYNHTGNGFYFEPSYYILDQNNHTNYTGCGNTVNCNCGRMKEMILASLTYYVEEMHVDGFRFDLASIFCRGNHGEVLEKPPIIEEINKNPILKKAKMIAEPWDCAGLYQVGSFPGKWAEWNGKFRDHVRRFIKGTDGASSDFAFSMAGSRELYDEPYRSINFITAHDGFTLKDLVSYNEKHNRDNGEENKDGNNWNESWNCGEEGETSNNAINFLREKQERNFLLALGLSIGTPMFLMGDEYGHTRDGNNNAYCQDNQKNYFLWNTCDQHKALLEFYKNILKLRKNSPVFHKKNPAIIWHGKQPERPNWGEKLVAYTLEDFYIAFNAGHEAVNLVLPEGKNWKRVVDSSLLFFDQNPTSIEKDYYLAPYSCLVLSNMVS